jgi:hypothetical protein
MIWLEGIDRPPCFFRTEKVMPIFILIGFFFAAEGLSLANCANSSGIRFTLFKNPSNFLSYGSLVAGLLIAAENNSKLSPLSKDLSIFPALKFFI